MISNHRILFLGAFENANPDSTNIWQRNAIHLLGYTIKDVSYKLLKDPIGETKEIISNFQPHLTLIAKGTGLDTTVVKAANEHGYTALWMPDYVHNWTPSMEQMISLCTASYMSRASTAEMAKIINSNSYFVPEGYDPKVHYPQPSNGRRKEEIYSVSHIGSLHGTNCHFGREEMLRAVEGHSLQAWGSQHREAVWKTSINLNFTEGDGTSDRLFKLMGAGGFVLCQYFRGLETMFTPGEHLGVFSNTRELQLKTHLYLRNPDLRERIACAGNVKVRQYTNDTWARKVTSLLL
jgi:hypothetical protein